MQLDKRAGGQVAPCAELVPSSESRTVIGPQSHAPASVLPMSLAAARAVRNARVTAESRKNRVASALDTLPVPSAQLLEEFFDLTSAEVRLAQSLARGLSLDEAARHLNIKMSTARTQLAAIFAKTDSQRQGKLIAILSRIAHID